MKKLIGIVALSVLAVGCKTSPTGRTQIALYSPQKMNEMGVASFAQMKDQQTIESNKHTNRYVRCIADKLIAQLPNQYANQEWEVVVFKENTANAFALPGGKIGVHTGLLNVAKDQHQLAAVMGHEVGHVIAEHANERVSQSSILQFGLQASNAALQMGNVEYREAIMQGLGVGAQVGVALPFSRSHESEADVIGLDLMAKAGFELTGSVRLWENMNKLSGERQVEFLSTHPVPETRMQNLKRNMPEAETLKRAAWKKGLKPACK